MSVINAEIRMALLLSGLLAVLPVCGQDDLPPINAPAGEVTINQPDTGYRGIWYMNQPSGDEYVYKYSGGLGTYCAKHRPFAIYSPTARKTFFCYGGCKSDDNRALLHMVSCFDHDTGMVPRPTILLDKQTGDAHDNPVISIDRQGYIWIFSTSHGRARPSYIHRSQRPWDVSRFDRIEATRQEQGQAIPITNFSYMQVWHTPELGFAAFFTKYQYPANRTLCFMSSPDGKAWSRWQRLAAIEDGHYQVSGSHGRRVGTMFNMHPKGTGVNQRTNLYYLQSDDCGDNWSTVDGKHVTLPLVKADNEALVKDYRSLARNVYLKDLQFDTQGHPVLLYLTSAGYQSGPQNSPRTWTITRWDGRRWQSHPVTESDNNYDFGELQLVAEDLWRIVAPTETGPQPFNPGGEIASWVSRDRGLNWTRERQMTFHSEYNHTYVRSVQDGHPDMTAIWADGHGRQPSESSIYIANAKGEVFRLPRMMTQDFERPIPVVADSN